MMLMRLENVHLFHVDGTKLLHAGELALSHGESWLVEGAHGAGKTTFLKLLAGAVEPNRGRVEKMRDVRVGMMFAQGGLLSNLSLVDNLALPLWFTQGVSRAEAIERARAALGEAGLLLMAEQRPHAVNARVRKLAQVARLCATAPDLILLDEPLEGLGFADQEFVRRCMKYWREEGKHCLVVSSMRGSDLGIPLERLSLMDGSLRPSAVP